MFRFLTWPVRYGFGLAFSLGLAAVPWVMMMLYSPLPPDLRVTATALSATRTAREAPQIVSEQAKTLPGSILSMEATQTSGPAILSTRNVHTETDTDPHTHANFYACAGGFWHNE